MSRLRQGVWHFYASYPGFHGDLAKAQVATKTSRVHGPNRFD